jgi:hypothetical protein
VSHAWQPNASAGEWESCFEDRAVHWCCTLNTCDV